MGRREGERCAIAKEGASGVRSQRGCLTGADAVECAVYSCCGTGLYRRHRRALFGFPDPQNRTSFRRAGGGGAVAVRWSTRHQLSTFTRIPKHYARTHPHTTRRAVYDDTTRGARFVPLHLADTAAAGSQPGETSSPPPLPPPPPLLLPVRFQRHTTTTSPREYLIIRTTPPNITHCTRGT